MSEPGLTLVLCGRLRLLDGAGAEIPVPQVKGRGLLALLGVAPESRRPRAWLQDKLWSASPPERGAASLRQLLMTLRAALGPRKGCLVSGPGWVGLDRARVAVRLRPEAGDWGFEGEPPEFAAGLDIADPEFEDWLRDQRLAFEDMLRAPDASSGPVARRAPSLAAAARGAATRVDPVAAPARSVAIARPAASDPALEPFADMIAAEIGAHLRALGAAEAVYEDDAPAEARGPSDLRLLTRAAGPPGAVMVQAQWRDGASGLLIGAVRRMLGDAASDPAAAAQEVVAEAVTAGVAELHRRAAATRDPSPEAQGRRALVATPVLGGAQATAECDRLLEAATQSRIGAVHWAYRAHLRVAAIIERMADPFEAPVEEAVAYARRALELDPVNPVARAIAAEVALHLERRPESAAALAEEAVRQDPASALVRSVYAQTLSWMDDPRRALDQALRARALAAGHPKIASWHMYCAIGAIRCGDMAMAERFSSVAHDAEPSFRPPLRFLAALRHRRGDEAGALEALRRLKAIEPDFTPEMMADPGYPVASLRATGLTAVSRIGRL